ncbi:T9SS type A sorting domain-containing protein [Arachidicoccus terrestris]|uniref:T9SS type A sorting domain-containing protein n=1 Tax=Arachidicoccus terrestris TaxID=2875539 RepID=UPI001CC77273|nr:T9SS type A sorting domain-containing protein [Arachidicoccus terrestris]UAY54645.1 T9SS type A sorting domain-containing protein [Arachidicoccus terrestris]
MYIQNIDKTADSLIVDGFTITKANTSLYQYGRVPGGLSISDAYDNTLIRSCRFLENYSLLGAAMMIWGTKGAGISSLASPQIINCEFSGNADVFLIDDNSEFLLLPGVISNFQAAPFFSNCIFTNNKTFYGGVIVNTSSYPVIYNSDFSRNTAWGISVSRVMQDSHMILINCKITDNTNIKLPDGVWDDEVSRGLLSFFDNNILSCEGNSSLRLINTTIAGNKSLISADADKNLIINSDNSRFYMTNSIIWGNGSNSILDTLGMPSKISYSLIQGKSADATNHNLEGVGVGDIFADSAGADYRLSVNSPVIDAGLSDSLLDVIALYTNNDPAGGLDLAAGTRIQGSNVDLGAYESAGDALAVEMGALKGKLSHDGHAILSWMTYTEVQNKGFQLQVSLDGIIFRDLVFIPSLASGGNSNARISYYFDAGAMSDVKYYRVMQVDLNGRRKQSNIVMLEDILSFQLKAYPNPVHNTLHIQVEGKMAGHARILMIDFSGKLVHRESLEGPDTTIDMQRFAGGVYLVRYLDDTRSSIIKVKKK